ncbi:MAG: hypothetical protein ACE5DM_04110, partial [Candidatus Nanoarchaeia archaeon]
MAKAKTAKKTKKAKPVKANTPKAARSKNLREELQKTDLKIKDADFQKDTKNLIWIIVGIVALFAVFISIRYVFPIFFSSGAMTIDEMHSLNLQGKLENETAYVYDGFSFIKVGDLWYTQLQKGDTIFDVTFNYGPREVKNITVEGGLSQEFIDSKKFYITFDPEGEYLKYVAVANYGLSNSLVRAFGFDLTAGCLKNVTADCAAAEIITCEDKDKNVFYFKEGNETKLMFSGNCVIIQGKGEELVRAKDRLLLRWYNILR